jgi:hypothetical protein
MGTVLNPRPRPEPRPGRHRRIVLRLASVALVAAVLLWAGPAPATIQEQRNRLPPPAECTDPVAGIWKSHQYDPRFGDWTVFELDIHRVDGSSTQLTGTIKNHSWDAGPDQQEPPGCRPGYGEWLVSMDARGTVDAQGNIHFGGVGAWRLDQVICNWGPGGYNLDNFSGAIDRSLNEFQSVNNDGGRAVNDPTVFRRIRCHNELANDDPRNPNPISTPPPFYPRFDTPGCD